VRRLLFSFVSLVLLASVAWAQDSFDVHVAQFELLQDRAIQNELGITERQRDRMNVHAEWFNAESKKLQAKYEGKPDNGGEAAMNELNTMRQTMKGRVLGELTANQVHRLAQISLQDAGVLALMDDQVASKVGLSSSAMQTLRDEFRKNGQKAAELEQKTLGPIYDKYRERAIAGDQAAQRAMQNELDAARRKIAPQMDQYQREFLVLMDKTLSDENKMAFARMQGVPYAPR